MDDLTCKIEGVVYSDKNTGFYILKVKSTPDNRMTTVKGNFPGSNMTPGLKAVFKGDWVDHPKYGRQLSAHSYEIVLDKSRVGIIAYLTANVPSIGPITAGKLYSAYGDDLVDILENNSEKILECDFLQDKQARAIIEEWNKSSELRNTSIQLTNLGLTSYQVRSVYNQYGSLTMHMVKKNPYCLYDCAGVGFQTADNAARKLGFGVDDPKRFKAIILYSIESASTSDGNMWVISDHIRNSINRMFQKGTIESPSYGDYISDTFFYNALRELKEEESIISNGGKIYLSVNWEYESESAKSVSKIASKGPPKIDDLDGILKDFEESNEIDLSHEQKLAFLSLKKSRVCVISGYPGTGKTTLISSFVHLFEKLNKHYVLMSPTGIAAKRLSQVTSKPASTIHRALGYGIDGSWEFCSSNKFIADAVIVDEMSMVDSKTFYHLVTALSENTILILIGDSAQLPSVGAGYVLNNLMNCNKVPHVSLTRIYRQEYQSDIVKVSHAILNEEEVSTSFDKNSEFIFLQYSKSEVLDEIDKLTSLMKEKKSNFQVISPMYDGDLGVNNLNKRLRSVLNVDFQNGNASKMKHGSSELYEGDRVMVTKNNYDKMIFNGDVGKVQRISLKNDEVEVRIFNWFDESASVPTYTDKVFIFKVEEAKQNLKVAYACTTHRCVSPETLVETPDGIVQISDIAESGSISTPNGCSTYINKVVNKNGPMLRITTVDGYSVEVTLDHGIDTWDSNNGYIKREAHLLKQGDIIPLRLSGEWLNQPTRRLHEPTFGAPNEVVHATPTEMTSDLAEFLGIMVADGTIYRGGFRVIKSSKDVINRFVYLCNSLFKITAKQIDHSGTTGAEVSSTFLSRWLMKFDGLAPKKKNIPNIILASSIQIQASFLRGLFEDGTVNIDLKNNKVDHIELVTAYRSICEKTKIMLLRFGIISGYRSYYRTLSDGSNHKYEAIYIYGENVKNFAEKIGFISREKLKRAFMPHGKNTKYQIPILKSEALEIRDANGGPKFFTNSDKNMVSRRRVSRHQLSSLLNKSKIKTKAYHDLCDRLKFHHSPIKSIEIFEGPSMCVEVPDGHRFIQNGFCGWNCQGQEYDYVIMPMTMSYGIMLYRNLIYTAITRAKKKVFVLGDPAAFNFAITNKRETTRNSSLHELIDSMVDNIDEEVSDSSET